MSRRRRAEIREISPDSRYGDADLAKFINKVMKSGKKSVAQRVVYQAFEIVQDEAKRDPLEIFRQAMKNATPLIEVRPRRVGGATYQVPTELRPRRSQAMAIEWLIQGARSRKGVAMRRGLASELTEASRGEGSAVRRKEELHRMAEANRAFVHFRV